MSGSQSIKTHKKQSEQRVPHVAAPKIKLHAQRVQQQEAAAAALEEREEVLEEQTEKKGKLPKIKIPEIGLKEKLSFRKESTASEKKTQDDDMEEDIFRLSTPRASGIWGLLFSRTFLFIILIVIQVLLWVGIYLWLQDKIRAFAALQWIFTLVMLVYLFVNQMDYSAKLTWMFLFALVPIPAAIFLLFTQTNFGHRTVRTRVQEMIAETKEELIQPPGVLKALEKDGGATDDLVRWMNRSGCFPAYAGSQTTYYPIGEEMFKSMIYELQRAERFIFLEYFILEEGYMWGSILEILLEKAAAGVEVRVMYDGMCEISTLPAGYWQKLRERGINAKAFAPVMPLLSSHYNYRDHRKIMVIDGKTAFTGGINLADEYINRKEKYGHWKDTGLMVKGDAVPSFTLMFLQMWNIDEESPIFSEYLDNGGYEPPFRSGCVIPYCDCPLDDDKVGETVYMDILNRASTYVHIMTPYLILDGEMETALKYAAERGVDVKIILPGIPDKKLAYALAKSHYYSLRKSGVQIYEYTPGFVHAKSFVCDDVKAVVGTINLDYRSLYHHYECATYMYRTACVLDIEKDFQETLEKSQLVTDETVKQTGIFYVVVGAVLKVLAPLM